MIRTFIIKLLKEKVISENELKKMETPEYSKEVFNLNFEILKPVDRKLDIIKQKQDSKGYNRYYDVIISTSGKEYLLCSQWVESLHRESFEKWLAHRLLKLLILRVSQMDELEEFTVNSVLSDYWAYLPFKIRKGLGRKFNMEVKNNKVQNVIEINKKKNNSQVYKNTL